LNFILKNMTHKTTPYLPKPKWLAKRLPVGGNYQKIKMLLSCADLHTVCQEANCPNMFECFSKNTATFMILGKHCTRNCNFCNIVHDVPDLIDSKEPARIADTVQKLGLNYVVITSVTRDDLIDGGAFHFADTIHAIKKKTPETRIEVLIPDFKGDITSLQTVLSAGPHVLNHNIETVESLYPKVRPRADYNRCLGVLKNTRKMDSCIQIKSGIMVGLGETHEQLEHTFLQIKDQGCDILTVGQYLAPTRAHLGVQKYYSPEEFRILEKMAKNIGFKKIAAGPFVRSSYQANALFES